MSNLPAEREQWTREDFAFYLREVIDNLSTWEKARTAAQYDVKYGDLPWLAEHSGVAYQTLANYRSVWNAYAQVNFTGAGKISFAAASVLAAQPDRLELIAARDNWTATEAEKLVQERNNPPVDVEVLLGPGKVETRQVPGPKHPHKFTEQKPDGGISWARWSWNPVTGCLHGCDYCYARALAYKWIDQYPEFGTGDRFIPMFRPYRLDGPKNTGIPGVHENDPSWKRVFVCSMADLYGQWVPQHWIDQVHDAMLASPQWQYILLTKFPSRYLKVKIPEGAWVGTSIDDQNRVSKAESSFKQLEGSMVKWLSLEPLLGELEFSDLSMFDWVVIGGQTKTDQPTGVVPAKNPPSREYVMRLTLQAKEAGCAVHWKPNIRQFMWYDEYPELPGEGNS